MVSLSGGKSDGPECPSYANLGSTQASLLPQEFSTESGSFPQAEYVTDGLY
jgi:hypothetical protein